MKKHLEYSDEKSNKFWKIEVTEKQHTVTYGKIGAKGTTKTKEFDTEEKALKDAEKLIKAKIKKGYTEVNSPLLVADQQDTAKAKTSNPNAKEAYIAYMDKHMKAIEKADLGWGMPVLYNAEDKTLIEGMLQTKFDYITEMIDEGEDLYDEANFYFVQFDKKGKLEKIYYPYNEIIEKHPDLIYLFENYVNFLINLGETIAYDETVVGIDEATLLAKFDKKYVDKFTQLMRNDDLNHETEQGEYFAEIIDHWECNEEAMALLAARACMPSQHGWDQLQEFADEYGFAKNTELFDRFVNALLRELQNSYHFKGYRHHLLIADDFFPAMEQLEVEFQNPNLWEGALLKMAENAKPDKVYDISGIRYALAIEQGEEATPPKNIPNEMAECYLEFAEHFTIQKEYEKSQGFLKVMSKKNTAPFQLTLKYYNELLNLTALGKSTKAVQKKFDEAYEKQNEFGNWIFDAFYTWIEDADLNKEQEKYCTELTKQMESVKEIHNNMFKYDRKNNKKEGFCYITQGNTLSYIKDGTEERLTFEYESNEALEAAITELVNKKRKEGFVNAATTEDNKKLLKAIKGNKVERIKELFEQGIQLDNKFKINDKWYNPISYSFYNANMETIEFLLTELTESYYNHSGNWKLLDACPRYEDNFNDILSLILKTNYEINEYHNNQNVYDNSGAISVDNLKILFERVPFQSYDHGKFVLEACEKKNVEQLKFLLEAGACPFDASEYPRYPVRVAVEKELGLEAIQLLIEAGSPVPDEEEVIEEDWNKALSSDANKGVKEYLAKAKKEKAKNPDVATILKSTESLKKYLKNGGDANKTDEHGLTLLHYCLAQKKHDYEVREQVNLLLKKGANPSAETKEGRTPLFYINFFLDDNGIIKNLISKGADVNHRDQYGLTPVLFHAKGRPMRPEGFPFSKREDYDACKAILYLVSSGADINTKAKDDKTIMHHVVDSFDLFKDDAGKALLHAGFNPSITDKNGQTILHYLAKKSSLSLDEGQILEAMANLKNFGLEIQDNDGNTALHIAAKMNHYSITRDLLEFSANPIVKNNEGKTPEEYMLSNGLIEENERIAYHVKELKEAILNPPAAPKWEAIDLTGDEVKDVEKMEILGNYPFYVDEYEYSFENIVLGDNFVAIWHNCEMGYDPETGKEIWKNDGYSHYKSYKGKLLCKMDYTKNNKRTYGVALLNPKDPKVEDIIWRQKISAGQFHTTDYAIFCHSKQTLYRLNPENGDIVWKLKMKSFFKLLWNDLLIVSAIHDDGLGLYFLNPETAEIIRFIPITKTKETIYTYTINGNFMWYTNRLGDDDFRLVKLNLETGEKTSFFDEESEYLVPGGNCSPHFIGDNMYMILKDRENDTEALNGMYLVSEEGEIVEKINGYRWFWRDRILYAKNCIYAVGCIGGAPYFVHEYNLITKETREATVKEFIETAAIRNGKIALLQHGSRQNEYRIQFIH